VRLRALLWVVFAAASCATTAAQDEPAATITQAEALDTFGIGSGRDGDFAVPAAGTVLNSYAPVASVDPSATQVTVGAVHGAAAGFAAGNLVVLWHTTGLATATSGDQTAIALAGDVGAYEFARVKSVNASVLTLTNPLSTPARYAAGSQVVRIPEYKTLTVGPAASVAPYVWDGSAGGIVAIFATVAVVSTGAIQADAAGFRGGGIENAATHLGCTSLDNWSNAMPCGGAHKGEGLFTTAYAVANPGAPGTAPATTYGRGNYADGAGGGDAHNAGGGGGGHAGTGGLGGRTWIGDVNAGGPRFVGGLGGAALTYSLADHLAFGGGGGAGEENNAVGTSGGAGGGVVLIRAGSLAGNGTVSASGGSVTAVSGIDGSGGGGAGGAVLIQVQAGAACGSAAANGGSGGSGSLDPDGPGGGGAGGYVTVNAAGGTCPVTAAAGAHGTTHTVNAVFTGMAYGSTDGTAGVALPASGAGLSAGVCTPAVLGNNQCGGCVLDSDCPAGQPLCDTGKNSCGVCTSSNRTACTGATPTCDTMPTHDTCAGCDGNFGSAATRPCPTTAAPSCVTSGANAGACAACNVPSDCSGTAPVCSSANACVACNGDNGTTATSPCPTSNKPYCQATGACGVCANDASCGAGHAGPFCNALTGACSAACFNDAECGAGNWCNTLAGPGLCQAKASDGQPVPGGNCTAAIAARACLSGDCTSSGPTAGTCGLVADGGADAGDGGGTGNADAGDGGQAASDAGGNAGDGAPADASGGDANDGGDSASPDAGPGDASDAGDTGSGDANDAAGVDAGDAGTDVVMPIDVSDAVSPDTADDGQTTDVDTTESGAEDANSPDVATAPASGTIAGGGLSCSTLPGAGRAAETSPIALACALLLLGAHRRKREKHRSLACHNDEP